ncbi:hypothetical protein ACOSP7_000163 [Xanthoceras sorbifolium]|uniref:CASP-like protein n=1 Tax=Xanthoceras sorbifolium TaxID=99658 RepID=A0ABQ8IP92_9ROSI|nr:hypothetical protein JRO89_XS01G0393800 [Xanthoceras sorbifolium]
MENTEAANPMKTQKLFHLAQICLRISAIATTLAATSVMVTSRQSIAIFGTTFDARYSYSSAFKFFAFANAIACAFSVLSLLYVLILCRQGSNPSHYFFLFLHDLLMMSLVLASCAAATAVGYIGKFGNNHIGWVAICDQFGKFCNRVTISVILSYLSVMFLLVLTIGNASRSRQVGIS